MSKAELEAEVVAILDMFEALKKAPDEAKDGIEPPWAIKFGGFYLNTELKQLRYAESIVKGNRYMGLTVKDSHLPTLPRYRSQLAAWRQSANPHQLSADDVRRIAAAADLSGK